MPVRGHKGKQQKAGVQVPAGYKTKIHPEILYSSLVFHDPGAISFSGAALPAGLAQRQPIKGLLFALINKKHPALGLQTGVRWY